MSSGSKPRWGGAPNVKCEKCGKTVYPAEKVSLEQRIFHNDCIRCENEQCNKKLDGANFGGFIEDKGYCRHHLTEIVKASGAGISSMKEWKPKENTGEKKTPSRWGSRPTDKCEVCTKTVYPAEKVSMEGRIFHGPCLRCTECNKQLGGSNWGGFVDDGDSSKAYCKTHINQLIAATGSSTGFTNKEWKPKEKDPNAPKTQSRWGSRPTDKCVKCGKTVYPAEKVSMEKRIFHAPCLRCTQCNKPLTGANFGNFLPPDDEPYCKSHWDQLVARIGDATSISGSTAKRQAE